MELATDIQYRPILHYHIPTFGVYFDGAVRIHELKEKRLNPNRAKHWAFWHNEEEFTIRGNCDPKWNRTSVQNKSNLISWLLEHAKNCYTADVEYPSFDGWHHNLAKFEIGSVGQKILEGWAGIQNVPAEKNWTAAWSQLQPHISMCRPNTSAINLYVAKQVAKEMVNTGDDFCATEFKLRAMPYEINYATPYIDGEIIYGNNEHGTHKTGMLNVNDLYFDDIEDNYYSAVLRIIWIKLHNLLAEELHHSCKKWSSEQVFHESRKFVIALQQNYYIYEWFVAWTGEIMPPYERYNPLIDPQVEVLFKAAMYLQRYIPESQDNDHINSNIRNLYNSNAPDTIHKLMEGQCRSFEVQYRGAKLMSQHLKLPDINHAHKILGLTGFSGQEDFLKHLKLPNDFLIFEFARNSMQGIDAWFGGVAQSVEGPGPLFRKIIKDQFLRSRDGDRFWFENQQNRLFTSEEICKIRQIKFRDIISMFVDIPNTKSNVGVFRFKKTQRYLTDLYTINIVRFGVFLLGYFVALIIFVVGLIIKARLNDITARRESNLSIRSSLQNKLQIQDSSFLVLEYNGAMGYNRRVLLVLKKHTKQIAVYSVKGVLIHIIRLASYRKIDIIIVNEKQMLVLKCQNSFDLPIVFDSQRLLDSFIEELNIFLTETIGEDTCTVTKTKWKTAEELLFTKERHQICLEMFLRVAFAQTFGLEHSLTEILAVDSSTATKVIYTELSIIEFAECLSMNPHNEFVHTIFSIIDRKKVGWICFRSFLDFLILYANGEKEDKARFLFKLYDIDGTDQLLLGDFIALTSSFLDIVGNCKKQYTDPLIQYPNLHSKDKLHFHDFKMVLGSELNNLSYANLASQHIVDDQYSQVAKANPKLRNMYSQKTAYKHSTVAKQVPTNTYCANSPLNSSQRQISVIDKEQGEPRKSDEKSDIVFQLIILCRYNAKRLFWFAFIVFGMTYIFIDKTYDVFTSTQFIETRRVLFAIARGSSYGILLTYAMLFITMCRNISRSLRDTIFNIFIPFHDLTKMHYFMGYLSFIFTALHIVGHTVVFLSFTPFFQRPCKMEIAESIVRSIFEQKWHNIYFITGVILLALVIPFYTLAIPYIRSALPKAYYIVHCMYPILICLIYVHGFCSQKPLVHLTLTGPFIVYLLDKLIRVHKKAMVVSIKRAEVLLSNVVCLTIHRPPNFHYDLGQTLRLAISHVNPYEYQHFNISSSPFESELRIYVKSGYPFAHQLLDSIECVENDNAIQVLIDGPYGTGIQRWRIQDVAVFVADGGFIEMFSSALHDIIYLKKNKIDIPCKKAYFVWSFKNEKSVEWVMDLIREVENIDQDEFFSAHLFVTEEYQKFDMKTILSMITEKFYPRISDKALFTGLRAVTHFKEPNLLKIFQSIEYLHKEANTIGVFSSGPNHFTMTMNTVYKQINALSKSRFEHFNF